VSLDRQAWPVILETGNDQAGQRFSTGGNRGSPILWQEVWLTIREQRNTDI
jgi:hypothetical protein